MNSLSHLDESGRAHMVDVTKKAVTDRRATAEGKLRCRPETLDRAERGETPKGAVVQTAELAGVMAAKRTHELVPLCHPLPLGHIDVRIEPDRMLPGYVIRAEVRSRGATGVEMEALTAVSIACLTLFDMLKAIDRSMEIGEIRVTTKEGGRSGDWTQP